MKNKLFMCFLGLFLYAAGVQAQEKEVAITGVVQEEASKQPVPFATVIVVDKATEKNSTGVTTDESGKFSLTTTETDFYIEVSFLGYTPAQFREFSVVNGKVDLGIVFLSEDSKALDEILVTAEKSTTEFKLDKRVFNVGKDISSTGMGALEVLNNVPSVNVNIEGEVSLRGTGGVQILVNGKPVVADDPRNALGTITADMIEKIEVITNPSAKYDAEGTAGILNIVLKKEEKKGVNGSVSLNTGTPDNHSIGISLNRRTERFNLFTQLGMGYRSLPRDSETNNRNLVSETMLSTAGTAYRNEIFYNITLGTDYHINPKNILTLSGNFAYEVERQPSRMDFRDVDAGNTLVSAWNREETTEATNPKWRYEFQYKKEFENHKDHTLLFSALGTYFGKDLSSEFVNTTTAGNTTYANQQTETAFEEATYTFKLDYTNPLTDHITLETGAQYVMSDVGNDYEVRDLIDGDWVQNTAFTNNFEYDQKVLGVYGTGAYEGDKWGIKLGLRVEGTDLATLLTNTGEANEQRFTNLFPSMHTSYKFTDAFSLQAGYSRRIYRPRLWDLNPFFTIRNNFNIRTGNPRLQPQFTDAYEFTGIVAIGEVSLNASVFYLYTTDVIERISFFEDNVTTTMPLNIGDNHSTGIEVNATYSPVRWLKLAGDVNYGRFSRNGSFESQSFDFDGSQWSSRLTNKIKLPGKVDLELTGRYRSGFQTVQGEVSQTAFMDVGLRKKLLGGKAVVNLGVRDVFASRIFESVTEQTTVSFYSYNQRGRFVTLGFSYGFGKGEAMTYSGGRR